MSQPAAAGTLLVVEPEPVLAPVLSALGHGVRPAGDGPEALLALAGGAPDVALVDLAPGGFDPLPVLRALRTHPALQDVPLLALAPDGEGARAARLAALRAGADEVLARPLDAEELGERLARLLERKRRLDGLLQQATELQRLSVTDGLTQAFNHRHFQERLGEEVRRALRYDDPLALVLVDLDHFKAVNDTWGHPAGDRVLREVAQVLRACVRETDVVARYGGEEFAVLLPRTHLPGALTVAERIWRDVGALHPALPARPAGLAAPAVTASVGLAALPQRGLTGPEDLLRAADEALYRAKREGRNRVCLHAPHAHLPLPPRATPTLTQPGSEVTLRGRPG